MTSVQKVDNTYKKPVLNPKNTGYAAAGAIAIASIRAFNKTKPIVKSHKIIGYVAGALTLLHIGVVEFLHHKYKKRNL